MLPNSTISWAKGRDIIEIRWRNLQLCAKNATAAFILAYKCIIILCILLVFVIRCCRDFVRIREKDKGQSYALSMSYRHTTKHYKIDKRKTVTGEMLAIEEGPTFENLMDVSSNCSHV